jgi:hypothetical protein
VSVLLCGAGADLAVGEGVEGGGLRRDSECRRATSRSLHVEIMPV